MKFCSPAVENIKGYINCAVCLHIVTIHMYAIQFVRNDRAELWPSI
jgi:hypothetical protein